MKNDYITKFNMLGYSSEEIAALLEKIANSKSFTQEEYEELMTEIDFIKKSTSFNNEYIINTIIRSITTEENMFKALVDTNDFATNEDVDIKLYYLNQALQEWVEGTLENFEGRLEETKADKDHNHDDRYSLYNHTHEGVYVTTTDINNYVTKEYLDIIISNLGSGGGGGSVFPTYIKPTISVKANTSSVQHKKETKITITPNYIQNDAGEIVKFSVIKDSKVIYESTQISNIEVTLLLKHGEMATYVFKVDYEDGPIKNTTAGVPHTDGRVLAGSISTSFSIKCIGNSYIGVIPDRAFDVSDVNTFTAIRNSSKSYTNTYSLVDQKSVYMYPKSFGELVSAKDANNFEYINSYVKTTITYDDIEYLVYVLMNAVMVEGGFKQSFN